MAFKIDLTGQEFGYLSVIGFSRQDHKSHSFWMCKCVCGVEKEFRSNNLRRGLSQSCGCMKGAMITDSKIRHGLAGARVYKCWAKMRQRCINPKDKRYDRYGGRGIKVCDRWQSFENFYADMGEMPEKMTLDRIDVNGDYCPENCRWTDMTTQQRNKSNNNHITWNGETKLLCEWAETLGINQDTLGFRINSPKWTLERAMTQPLRKHPAQKI